VPPGPPVGDAAGGVDVQPDSSTVSSTTSGVARRQRLPLGVMSREPA
jgi:hypothetical protein